MKESWAYRKNELSPATADRSGGREAKWAGELDILSAIIYEEGWPAGKEPGEILALTSSIAVEAQASWRRIVLAEECRDGEGDHTATDLQAQRRCFHCKK